MKRLFIPAALIAAIALTGCTESNNADAEANQPGIIEEKKRIIQQLEAEVVALEERVSTLEQQPAEAVAACSSPAAQQEPVNAEAYKDFQKIETKCYSIYIPKDWSYRLIGGNLEFVKDRLIIGETETLDYYTREAAEKFTANHVEQTSFKQSEAAPFIEGADMSVYQLGLEWEKPAAAMDPDWRYKETKVLIALNELELSYSLGFSADDVSQAEIDAIIQSFRLHSAAS